MEDAQSESTEFEIEGMTCEGCTDTVESAVRHLPGVDRCTVSLATSKMRVWYDKAMVTKQRIVEEIEQAGYYAEMMG